MLQGGATGQAPAEKPPVEFQEKQRYCGEQVMLIKPPLANLKQQIQQMQPDEINKY